MSESYINRQSKIGYNSHSPFNTVTTLYNIYTRGGWTFWEQQEEKRKRFESKLLHRNFDDAFHVGTQHKISLIL